YHFETVSSRVVTSFKEHISELQASIVRETRDNPLDARRGYLLSLSLDVSPRQLGSEPGFFRSMAQAFLNQRLGSSFTWSHGYRLGLSGGLAAKEQEDQRIFGRSGELFRAGGGNSLRGFAAESVGPKGVISGISSGGEALVIVNQELRYHHPSGLG